MEQFFRNATSDSGMAFVLVQHLDPSHASLLTEILQRTTTMPVIEAVDQVPVEPNCVYVIPPNRDMTIFHGTLQLSVPNEPHGQRMPIDVFLRSLADDRQENAIGIILSGTGTDGTRGLGAIRDVGGITLVQEPSTAKYDGMPSSAIQAGNATHVLPVEKMRQALLLDANPTGSRHTRVRIAAKAASGINRILMHLRSTTGHDFALYKKSTIARRIERRMSEHNIEDTEVYVRYLKENPAEVNILFKELLINVTSFFRDPEAFAVLRQDILPRLCKDKKDGYPFRVWVSGCATGEEAYSIAILLREVMDETHQELKVQIYSTDLDEDAIAIARAGLYPATIAQDVTPDRLRHFFIKEDGGYRIKKEIREMVVFAVQSAIKDPPFTKLDLLSCRNLMIYLEPELQNRLISLFHYALKPNGVLFLSSSESIGNHVELFSTLDRKWKFYCAIHRAATPRTIMSPPLTWTADSGRQSSEDASIKPVETNFAELTRRALVQCFAPASVITDLKGEILYIHGETGKYLRPAPGQATLNVVDMAREGLELELRAAIRAAASEGTPTLNRELQVKTNGGFTTVGLSVRPLPSQEGGQNLLLASFQDIPTPPAKRGRKRTPKPAELTRIEELERDLAYLKESHQATVEEQQAANEELKSTNEEMQSTNEELQSTNEELETSKEELQSVNEELITVNSELQAKIEQLAGMQNDMKNLLDNINIGIVFLDEQLVIRRFTREATNIFRLVPSDVGRLLLDIKTNLDGEELLTKAQSVLESLVPFEQEMRVQDGAWYLVRIQPYRTLENVIEGVVLTFTDISKRIAAEAAVQVARELAESIVDTIRQPLLVLDSDLQIVSANRAFYQYFQVLLADTVGRKIYDLGNGQWNIPVLRELLEIVLPRDQAVEGYVVQHDFPVIGRRTIVLNARRIVGKTSEPSLILLTAEELGDESTVENKP
ncbi:CheR family methyltransferase [Methylococcus sp. EFPC2]|uniref:CheR family methyltransferase n=1 Tax=Methylococcus sp. EFPC2 TaxID=2812648 RepID=UPI001F07B8E4|nr:CheR family methyltransferase [Methylococcus sp. EFPC2]